jgi:hypothetical protein
MKDDLEALVAESLDGGLDSEANERLAKALEADPQSRAEYADQLQIHHRLRVALEKPSTAFVESVAREIRLLGDADRFSQGVVRHLKEAERAPMRRRVWELAAAGLILAAVGYALLRGSGTPQVATPEGPQILFVVGRLPLAGGDERVKERFERLGFRVAAKPALQVLPSDGAGKALIAISSTSLAADVTDVPGELTAKFRDAAVPVLVWEPRLYHDLGMVAGSHHMKDWGTVREQSRVAVTNPTHPMAAGLASSVKVLSAPNRISWGLVRSDALVIATVEGDPARAALFAYEAGARMPGLEAPARRVGLFLFEATPLQLTPEGWSLFDAAVRWSASK